MKIKTKILNTLSLSFILLLLSLPMTRCFLFYFPFLHCLPTATCRHCRRDFRSHPKGILLLKLTTFQSCLGITECIPVRKVVDLLKWMCCCITFFISSGNFKMNFCFKLQTSFDWIYFLASFTGVDSFHEGEKQVGLLSSDSVLRLNFYSAFFFIEDNAADDFLLLYPLFRNRIPFSSWILITINHFLTAS
jgi:hypothetical protein